MKAGSVPHTHSTTERGFTNDPDGAYGMDATSTLDLGGLSGQALGVTWGLLVGVVLLIAVTAIAARRVVETGPSPEPVAETARA